MSIRVGFIGVGIIATTHLVSLLRRPEVEVASICDISPEQVEITRSRVNKYLSQDSSGTSRTLDAPLYSEYSAMLRDEKLDAVYICLPPFVHGEPEMAVIEAGVPMLVEKPVALDISTAMNIHNAARERNVIVATGYQFRYTEYLRKAKELLQGHTIAQAMVTRIGTTPGTSWYHLQHRSGGQIIEMATHQVDMLRYLVGEVRRVYAEGATLINNRARPDYDIYDVNAATLSFENGAVGSFASNFIVENSVHLESWGVHIFADGLVVSLGNKLRASTADGTEEFPLDSNPVYNEDTAFLRAATERNPDFICSDYVNGIRTLAVTIAADQSARSHEPVEVAGLLPQELHS